MRTAAKKSAPRAAQPTSRLDQALKTAQETVAFAASETKQAAEELQEKVKSAATKVKQTGQELASDPKAFVENVVEDGKKLRTKLGKKADQVKADVSREAARLADVVTKRVSGAVETVVEKSLHRLNVPTRAELRALTQKVDSLAKKIDTLHRARPAARRAR